MATRTLAAVNFSDACAIDRRLLAAGASAAIDVIGLAGSIRRLAVDEEDNRAAIVLMAERIGSLSDALVQVLDYETLSASAAAALGLDGDSTEAAA